MVLIAAACNRSPRDPETDGGFDGGLDVRDAATPLSGRGGGRTDAGPVAGRAGAESPGGNGAAGVSGALAGGGGSGVAGGVAGGAAAGGAGGALGRIDCRANNGGCGDRAYWQCVETPNGGYCSDRDECTDGSSGCDPLTYCINVRGGPPGCSPCPGGYEGDGRSGCTDIDECKRDPNTCGDSDFIQCVNEPGWYRCDDILECDTDNGGCGEPDQYFCVEQPQAAPLCRVNECFADNGGCGSTDQLRCLDRPDVTAICVAKVADLSAWAPLCLVRSDNTVDCLATQVQPGSYRLPYRYKKFASSATFHCGIEVAGSIRCERAVSEALLRTPTGTNFTDLSGGFNHACALRSDGTAACWGTDREGSVTGPNAETDIRQISAGTTGTCLVRNSGTIECFGLDEAGELEGANDDGGTDFIGIYAGLQNVCALHMDGRAECWGNDTHGQVTGVNEFTDNTFQSLSIGSGAICGLLADSTVRCWGKDEAGQVSGPNGAGSGVAQMTTGPNTTCLRFTDGTFRCYGVGAAFLNNDPWVRP